jgi:nucleotide-binding universal stress UspA family protein
MSVNLPPNVNRAIQDFRSARQKATLSEIIARFKGESNELLSFEEVRHKLNAQVGPNIVLKEIPIKSIIGSVNRYQDFMRDFLPRHNIDVERWSNIELASQGLVGLPPIEVYQIDEVYFVIDGNHRVSVAKQLGDTEIEAYVTELQSRVSLTADVRPEDLILKSEYAKFLENTNLDKLRPDADLTFTEPGQFDVIKEHIAVHRYFMGLEQKREISSDEAVANWYDKVYFPVVNIIREKGLLIDFPNRTETDLYLWIVDHRAALEEDLKSQVPVASAMDDLTDRYSQRTGRVITRIGIKIVNAIVPEVLNSGPPTGEWRQTILSTRRDVHLFCDILVPINGHQDGWFGLEQAIVIARREETNIHGLYVLANGDEKDSPVLQDIQNEFHNRCEAAGIKCDLQLKTGDIIVNICELARWNDLVVLNITYPPEQSALARLLSGIRNLIQRCPRPILFTPQTSKPLNHALLVFDGSMKGQEALYIAAYMGGQWKLTLHVISIGDETAISEIQAIARGYLGGLNIQAEYFTINKNKNRERILDYVDQLNIDLLVTGGYSHSPVVEVFLGSYVDEILRQIKIPIIISR